MNRFFLIFAILPIALISRSQTLQSAAKLTGLFEKSMTIDKFLALSDAEILKYNKSFQYEGQGFADGHGIYAWPPALKAFPKKVGLLSFIVFDPGLFVSRIPNYGTLLNVTDYSGKPVSLENTGQLSNFIYQESLPELKVAFISLGSKLLTTSEFISSEAIRQAYNTFAFEDKEISRGVNKQINATPSSVPEVQHPYYSRNLTSPAFIDALGTKAGELGLDAVAIVEVLMGLDDKGTICIQSIQYALLGKNPIPIDPDVKYGTNSSAAGYHSFTVYNACKMGKFDMDAMQKTDEGLNIVVYAENKKSKVYKLDRIGKLVSKIVYKSNNELNAWITGKLEPFRHQ